LVLEVEDDGVGFGPGGAAGHPEGSGIGLANTRDRLKTLYGEAGRLSVSGGPEGGALVRLDLPGLRREAA
ncbi:MAG: sensor histidine kinase, partial [Acidobacteriota bacterium]